MQSFDEAINLMTKNRSGIHDSKLVNSCMMNFIITRYNKAILMYLTNESINFDNPQVEESMPTTSTRS